MGISYNQANLHNHSTLDTRMNIKKLIASVVIALGAWMSVGVSQAQTNYNFDVSLWSATVPTNSGFNVFDPTYLGSLDFVATGNLVGGNIVLSNPTSVSFGKIDPFSSSPLSPVYTQSYAVTNLQGNVGFNASGNYASIDPTNTYFPVPGLIGYGNFNSSLSFTANGHNYSINYDPSSFNPSLAYYPSIGTSDGTTLVYGGAGVLTLSGGGAAPEMNASFIPQVALMLACLFFLFGRKKENTEVILAA